MLHRNLCHVFQQAHASIKTSVRPASPPSPIIKVVCKWEIISRGHRAIAFVPSLVPKATEFVTCAACHPQLRCTWPPPTPDPSLCPSSGLDLALLLHRLLCCDVLMIVITRAPMRLPAGRQARVVAVCRETTVALRAGQEAGRQQGQLPGRLCSRCREGAEPKGL